MSSNRLIYDTCAYKKALTKALDPFPIPCIQVNSKIAQNAVSN